MVSLALVNRQIGAHLNEGIARLPKDAKRTYRHVNKFDVTVF